MEAGDASVRLVEAAVLEVGRVEVPHQLQVGFLVLMDEAEARVPAATTSVASTTVVNAAISAQTALLQRRAIYHRRWYPWR